MTEELKKDNTKAIITIGFLAVFTSVGLALALSMATLRSANEEMSNLIEGNAEKTSLAFKMRDVIRSRSAAMKTLVKTAEQNERKKIFDTLNSKTASYLSSRKRLEALGANEREAEILYKLAYSEKRVGKGYNKVENNIFGMDYSASKLKSLIGDVQLRELVLLYQLNNLVQLEKALAEETVTTSHSRFKKTQNLFLALGLAAFVISMLIAGFVIERVSRANKRIAHLANHDDLTGLNNRRSFEVQLEHTVAIAPRSQDVYGLMFVDLDRFKIVNDTCGHHAGDQLLIEFTYLVQTRLRQGDMFARIGGDEFAIIARADTFENIVAMAEELRLLVSNFKFQYAKQTFNVSLSIGVIPVNGVITDIETVLSDVDSACYIAKQMGRNRVHVTQENDEQIVKYRNDIASMQNIRAALAEERLVLFYQPVYEIVPNGIKMAHCEILLRIKSESGELISPEHFIPIAEKYNMMTDVDRWVVSHVLDWVVAHQDDYETPKLLINLSGMSFINDEFLTFIVDQLQTRHVDPERLAFEITETAAVDNMDKANVFIDRVRDIGCQFALDDFGSGFSTFAYLKKLPIDYLKIDGSLVKNLATDKIDREMVKAINDIGHTVGAKTIAEFVEDNDTLAQLRNMGVDYAQGYGLSKPEALSELSAHLSPSHSGDLKKAS